MYKSSLIAIISLAFAAFFVVTPAHAAETTRVRGNIYNFAAFGNGINGLTVTVVCGGVTKTAVTANNGLYEVDYTDAQCPKYQAVTSSVTFNTQPQSQTVFVSGSNTATLDFYFGSLSVPEYGSVTGMLALFGSLGAFLFFRSRMNVSHAKTNRKHK